MPRHPVLFPNRPADTLVARAHRALGMSQRQLGDALGVSERTISRGYSRGFVVTIAHLHTLARLVHPRDPALADELAHAASTTLEELGIVAPSPPAPAPVPLALALDSVVCAAADAFGSSPAAARTALHAALKRARELGVRMEELEGALAPVAAKKKTTPGA
jgi:transcriptional regulator with XRE-family HTH domain